MVRHDDEPDASGLEFGQFFVEYSKEDSLRLIVIK
jgi:hypothetical protein